MDNVVLVYVFEKRLHGVAVSIMLLTATFRLAWGYLSTKSIWLNDSQIFTIAMIIALLMIGGCFVPSPWSYLVSCIGGVFGWIVALSLLHPTLWSQYPAGRAELPDWQVFGAVILAVAGVALRAILQLRWRRQLGGHSFRWMLDWAKNKPFYARVTAMNAMVSLGHRF